MEHSGPDALSHAARARAFASLTTSGAPWRGSCGPRTCRERRASEPPSTQRAPRHGVDLRLRGGRWQSWPIRGAAAIQTLHAQAAPSRHLYSFTPASSATATSFARLLSDSASYIPSILTAACSLLRLPPLRPARRRSPWSRRRSAEDVAGQRGGRGTGTGTKSASRSSGRLRRERCAMVPPHYSASRSTPYLDPAPMTRGTFAGGWKCRRQHASTAR